MVRNLSSGALRPLDPDSLLLFCSCGSLNGTVRSRCATSPASTGTRSDRDTSLCSRNQ